MSPFFKPWDALSRSHVTNRGKADRPHYRVAAPATLQPALRRAAIATVSVVALALPAVSSAQTVQFEDQGQMLGKVALAIAAHKASAGQCYYDSRDGKVFSDVDALFTRKLPAVWPRIRDAAPDDLPALQNTARIIGAKSDCVALGNAVGMGLVSALYVGQLDAAVSAEMERLSQSGGRGIGEPAPVSAAPASPKSAADMVKAYNDAHPGLNQPAPADHHGSVLPRVQPGAVPQAPRPGPDEASAAPADRDRTEDADAEANPRRILPELSDCLKDVDLSHNKNEGFARCYTSALAREDKRLNDEFATLKGRIFDPGKTSALALAQRTWVDFRDRWCAYEARLDEATSPEVRRLSCLVDLTGDQADRVASSYLP